jgi:hypothetical protein
MITNNKLDKVFGPVGTSSGILLFVAGLILTWFYFSGLILVVIGAFVGFTYESTLIDDDKKRVKFSNNLFGIIKTGKWIQIESLMKIGIKETNITWQAHSRGDRTIDITNKDFRIVLFDLENREIMPLKKTSSLESAKMELEILGNKLGISKIL